MKRPHIRFLPKAGPAKKPDAKHGGLVWVQCDGYRCLAYINEGRKWVNFYTGEKLKDFVNVIG
jgi:hypothetical protein